VKELLIFPFNGNGLEALSCLKNNKDYSFVGFIDDTTEKQGVHPLGFQVYDKTALSKFPNAEVLAVPGSPQSFQIRAQIIAQLKIERQRFATLIHPSANVSEYAKIGKNVLIMAGVCITSNAIIEDHVCILPNTVVHHDSKIGNYTLIGSNVTVAGNTEIGNNCYIGSGSSIINNISIGNHVLIGMGTNVIRNIEQGTKVVGNPARTIS